MHLQTFPSSRRLPDTVKTEMHLDHAHSTGQDAHVELLLLGIASKGSLQDCTRVAEEHFQLFRESDNCTGTVYSLQRPSVASLYLWGREALLILLLGHDITS